MTTHEREMFQDIANVTLFRDEVDIIVEALRQLRTHPSEDSPNRQM